jgi:hypothetical protein
MEGVRFYTRLKTVTARWPTGIRAGADTSRRRCGEGPGDPPAGGNLPLSALT